jgi:DnaJ like chaperone protein
MSIWARVSQSLNSIGGSISDFFQRFASGSSEPAETSVAFTIAMIALGAKIAKADGVVTGHEVAAFKDVFHIAPKDLKHAARVFNLAKQDVAGYDQYARQVAKLFAGRPQILEDVLDGLFHIAKSDGVLHDRELKYLSDVAAIFGLTVQDFTSIRARHVHLEADEPYMVLGLDPSASDETIKARYRQLVRDNHPDKHIAAGVPEELVTIATEKLTSINAAYDEIARERGI